MFWNKPKEQQVLVVHVNVGNMPSDKAKARVEEVVSAVREGLNLKADAKVIGLMTQSDDYIEFMYIDSNLIGE